MADDDSDLELRPQYDFSKGVRGKYAARYGEGSNVVVLDPDVAATFKTPQAVNDALREIIALVELAASNSAMNLPAFLAWKLLLPPTVARRTRINFTVGSCLAF